MDEDTHHLSAETVDLWRCELLAPEAQAMVSQHIAACRQCRRTAHYGASLVSQMTKAPILRRRLPAVITPDVGGWRWGVRLVASMAVVFVVFFLILPNDHRSNTRLLAHSQPSTQTVDAIRHIGFYEWLAHHQTLLIRRGQVHAV